jgi:hypothetical protein
MVRIIIFFNFTFLIYELIKYLKKDFVAYDMEYLIIRAYNW